jgi:glycosyltransferase involved in cell wall biosynthesis
MRIAFVCPRFAPDRGGIEAHVAALATRAAAAGWEVEVLTHRSAPRQPAREIVDGVLVRRFRGVLGGGRYPVAPGLWRHLRRRARRFDLVHAHGYHSVAALAAAESGHPALVFTPHYHGTGHSRLASALHVVYRRLGRRVFGAAQAVICVSRAEAELVARDFPDATSRVVVVPNGVDAAALRDAEPYPGEPPTVVCVGRLEDYKRVDVALAAVARLDSGLALRVVGDGPARPALEAQARRLGMDGRFRLLGAVDDDGLRRWYRTARVAVSLSEQEAFGLTLLEAAAAGTPVVASAIPSHREIAAALGDGAVSLVPVGADPATVAQAIEAQAARTVDAAPVEALPGWDEVAARTSDVYREVLPPGILPEDPAPDEAVTETAEAVALEAPDGDDGDASRSAGLAAWAAVWLGLVAGAFLLAVAYNDAAHHGTGTRHFALFWAGMLAFLVPAAVCLLGERASRPQRMSLVVAVGLFGFIPKFLRNPDFPLFHDELAHWQQSEAISRTGRLFEPNTLVTILPDFPGLHALTAALRELSGASTFTVGTVLLVLLHAAAVVGVFWIGERLTRSARIGGVAALLYSLNPSFLYFDSQYAYESLGVVLFIWIVAALVSALAARENPRQRIAWLACGAVLAGAGALTHHLSSYIAVATLGLVAAVLTVRARRGDEPWGQAAVAWGFAVFAGVVTAAWLVLEADRAIPYIEPHLTGGVEELARVVSGGDRPRRLFSESTLPAYERIAAFLAPVIALAGAALGLWLLRRARRAGAHVALALFGLLYFPAVPFILSQAGSEGARRSWAFTYLGLSLLIAPAVVWLLARPRPRRVPRWAPTAAVIALLAVVAVGNVAAGLDEQYRFPGPYVYGSDTRSLTPELIAVADWMRDSQGRRRRVVADRYTSLALASFGDQVTGVPSRGFPVWELALQPEPSRFLLYQLSGAGYRYMVIDEQMARHTPRIGVYFSAPQEPGAFQHDRPVSLQHLRAYEGRPWAIKLFQSDNLAVYRLDFAQLDTRYAPGRPRP